MSATQFAMRARSVRALNESRRLKLGRYRIVSYMASRVRTPFLLLMSLVFTLPALSSAESGDAASEKLQPEILGTWTLTLATPRGLEHPELMIYRKGDNLRGWLKTRKGKKRLRKISASGNEFSFQQEVPIPGGKVRVKFSGTIRGDKLQGATSSRLGKLPFTGIRKPSTEKDP